MTLHILPALGSIPLSVLTPQHVQNLLNVKREAGLSARRVQMIRAVLRTALNRAVKLRLIAHNAASDTPAPRVVRRDVPVLTADAARSLLAAFKGDRLEAMYLLALGTGCVRESYLACAGATSISSTTP